MASARPFLGLVTLLLSISVLQVSSLQHSATLKSFNELLSECSQYLPSPACSERCIGLVGRLWNDTTARTSVLVSRFYRPDPCDQNYVNRTLKCLCEQLQPLPRVDVCQRARSSLQCYRDQFGRLNAGDPLFVSLTELQSQQIFLDCAQMLGLSSQKLQGISQRNLSCSPEGSCLARCFLIRAGLYSDSRGPDIDRFAVQCEGYEAAYEESVTSCYAKLKAQRLDNCTLAARMYEECIQDNQYSNSNFRVLFVVYNLVASIFTSYGKLPFP